MCSGFGTIISACLKEFSLMVLGTLDGYYPNFIEILTMSGIFIISILIQATFISILLEKFNEYKVYTGYYLTNFLAGFITSQIIFGELLYEFNIGIISLLLGTIASLMMANEEIVDNNKLIQEV